MTQKKVEPQRLILSVWFLHKVDPKIPDSCPRIYDDRGVLVRNGDAGGVPTILFGNSAGGGYGTAGSPESDKSFRFAG
jgi:hypothetical protein